MCQQARYISYKSGTRYGNSGWALHIPHCQETSDYVKRSHISRLILKFKPEHACRMILVDQHNDDSTYRHMKYIHRVIKHKDTARDCFAFPAWCRRQSRSRCRAHYVWQISVLLQFTTAWRPFNVINDCYPFNDADTLMDNWYTLSCWTTHNKISH